jgi:hypothetical protein
MRSVKSMMCQWVGLLMLSVIQAHSGFSVTNNCKGLMIVTVRDYCVCAIDSCTA